MQISDARRTSAEHFQRRVSRLTYHAEGVLQYHHPRFTEQSQQVFIRVDGA